MNRRPMRVVCVLLAVTAGCGTKPPLIGDDITGEHREAAEAVVEHLADGEVIHSVKARPFTRRSDTRADFIVRVVEASEMRGGRWFRVLRNHGIWNVMLKPDRWIRYEQPNSMRDVTLHTDIDVATAIEILDLAAPRLKPEERIGSIGDFEPAADGAARVKVLAFMPLETSARTMVAEKTRRGYEFLGCEPLALDDGDASKELHFKGSGGKYLRYDLGEHHELCRGWILALGEQLCGSWRPPFGWDIGRARGSVRFMLRIETDGTIAERQVVAQDGPAVFTLNSEQCLDEVGQAPPLPGVLSELSMELEFVYP